MNSSNRIRDEITNIRDQVNKVLEDTLALGGNSFSVDIYQDDTHLFLATSPLLGLDTASLDIGISETNQITIAGETLPASNIRPERYLRRERKFGKFSRTFSLPVAVIPEEAKASFKQNVLTISIPKVVVQKGPKVVKVTPVE